MREHNATPICYSYSDMAKPPVSNPSVYLNPV